MAQQVLKAEPEHCEVPMEKLLLTVEESRQHIGGKGRGFLYGLIASGQIESVKLGRSRLILADSLKRYVDKLRTDQNQIGGQSLESLKTASVRSE